MDRHRGAEQRRWRERKRKRRREDAEAPLFIYSSSSARLLWPASALLASRAAPPVPSANCDIDSQPGRAPLVTPLRLYSTRPDGDDGIPVASSPLATPILECYTSYCGCWRCCCPSLNCRLHGRVRSIYITGRSSSAWLLTTIKCNRCLKQSDESQPVSELSACLPGLDVADSACCL